MEEGKETTENESLEGERRTGIQASAATLPSTDFVKVEKNLASIGFFTPSSKRTRNEKAKTVAVTITLDGKRVDAKATIAPTALFGLPITADQDKWLALHKILSDIQVRDGQVTNPVSFTSAQLLALLKVYKDSGKNYKDVSDWLDVMVGTTIISEGAVYFGGKRVFGKDTFHVFDRAVSFGKELPDGSIADKNYVWLSGWQLQNINDHYQLPIDLDTYRQLKNFIAKALVPLLQVWLYATRNEGVFEKRYDELCQILNVRQWNYVSKIKEKLGPSLDELKQFGYLADWQIETTSDKHAYKILFFHGEKFHRDRRARLARKQNATSERAFTEDASHSRQAEHRSTPPAAALAPSPSKQFIDPQLVAEFTSRGITEKKAHELIANLKPGQDVVAQLEHAEYAVRNSKIPISNPSGYIVRLIEWNTPVPDGFETRATRQEREERERKNRERRAAEDARQELEDEYERYCSQGVERYIEQNPAVFEALKEAKAKQERERYGNSWLDGWTGTASWAAKNEIRKQLLLLTFEEFVERKKQESDSSLKPVAPPLVTENAPATPVSESVPAAEGAATAASTSQAIAAENEAAIQPPPNPATEPAMPGPLMIELASERPKPEFGTDAASQIG